MATGLFGGELFRGNYPSQQDQVILELEHYFSAMRACVWGIHCKQGEHSIEQQYYIQDLKDIVHHAEDLLDEVNLTVRFPFSLSSNKIREIKNLRQKLESLTISSVMLGLNVISPATASSVSDTARTETCSSYVSCEEDFIIGRDAEKEFLVGMLLSDSNINSSVDIQQHVSSVNIMGVGGIGKTTLAQLVYNDARIHAEYELRWWVHVGEDFSIQGILSKILGTSELEIDELRQQFRAMVQGRRYLLVLDDVWCNDSSRWNHWLMLLQGGSKCRIVLITRLLWIGKVLRHNHRLEGLYINELQGLSEEDSWNLFHKVAFLPELKSDLVFVNVGKDITKTCDHHPLTIRVVGSMLRGQDIFKWLSFLDANCKIQTNGSIMQILKYCYHDLTPEIRRCFHVCSIFPNNYVIKKQVLMSVWLALGYLVPCHEAQNVEDIGEDYCSTLVNRGLFINIEQDEYGKVISFKMHHMIHDLAREQAGGEFLMLTDTNTHQMEKKIRYLSISKYACSINLFGQQYLASKTLRAVFNLRDYAPCSFKHVAAMLSQCRQLRLLDLHSVAIETLPDTFDKVPQLRYLDLSGNERLEKLPTSLTKLRCLQTLRLSGCKSLKELPEDIGQLVQLRNLVIDGCDKLTNIPAGMDNLACLHMFTMTAVGHVNWMQGNTAKLINMKDLVNLKGNVLVKVNTCSQSNMPNAFEGAFILKDAHLEALETICTDGSSDQGDVHETLLGIQGYLGTKLSCITLSHSGGLQHLTTLSQLHHLKYLRLLKLWNVESIEGDAPSELTSGAIKSRIFFPSLEKLVLEWMPKLKGWWRDLTWLEMETGAGCLVDGNGSTKQLILPTFPRLSDLKIRLCPSMKYFPPCPQVKQLELSGVHEAFCMIGRTLPNPVVSGSCNSGVPSICLEKLIVLLQCKGV